MNEPVTFRLVAQCVTPCSQVYRYQNYGETRCLHIQARSFESIVLNYKIVTIYYVNNTTYVNQQLLKVKILVTCFSYSAPSSGQKRYIVLVHSVTVHSMGSHIVYSLYYTSYVGWKLK